MSRADLGIVIIASLGLAVMVAQMSGLAGVLGVNEPPGETGVTEYVNESAPNSTVSVEGDAAGTGDSTAVSFIVSGVQTVVDITVGVVMLPELLRRYGLPGFAAYPFGVGLQLLTIWGVSQFVRGSRF